MNSAGNGYLGTSVQNQMPFVFSDILPGVTLSPENYDQVNPFGQTVNSRFLYHRSSEKEDENCFYGSAPTLHRPLGASAPLSAAPRAHSFLSPQSPQPTPQGGPHLTVPQPHQEKLSRAQLRPYSSSGVDLVEPVMVPELAPASDFEAFSDRVFHGSGYLQHKYTLTGPENGSSSTVNLLQLSSHLQRVEHQRSFMQVKQENDDFCCFITA